MSDKHKIERRSQFTGQIQAPSSFNLSLASQRSKQREMKELSCKTLCTWVHLLIFLQMLVSFMFGYLRVLYSKVFPIHVSLYFSSQDSPGLSLDLTNLYLQILSLAVVVSFLWLYTFDVRNMLFDFPVSLFSTDLFLLLLDLVITFHIRFLSSHHSLLYSSCSFSAFCCPCKTFVVSFFRHNNCSE